MLSELRHLATFEFQSADSTAEKAKIIIGFANGLFSHSGDNCPSADDPVTILKEAQDGQAFRCVEYSTLAAGLLWAYGIPARTIGLKTSDVETRGYGAGHVVIEFWDDQLHKWVMSDVQAGLIAIQSEVPLSAHELKQQLTDNKPVIYVPVAGSSFTQEATYDDMPGYTDWIYEYLYFIDTPLSLALGNGDKADEKIVMLVPPNVRAPKMFQGMFEMNALYTTNAAKFYAPPKS